MGYSYIRAILSLLVMAPQQSSASAKAAAAAGAPAKLTISVKTQTANNLSFTLAASSTIAHLKTLVAEKEKISNDLQRVSLVLPARWSFSSCLIVFEILK